MKKIFLLIPLCLLSACARQVYFNKPGVSNQEYYRDKSECQAFANIGQNRSSDDQVYYTGDNAFLEGYNTATAFIGESSDRDDLYLDCMRGKGYDVSFDKDESNNCNDPNHFCGQYNIGINYYDGKGVKKDYIEAARWFRRSAEQGFPFAERQLGRMYYEGEGVEKNNEEAFKWYNKAAEHGDASAQGLLGLMYYCGEGIEKNNEEAINWMNMAAAHGKVGVKEVAQEFLLRITQDGASEELYQEYCQSSSNANDNVSIGADEKCTKHTDCGDGLGCFDGFCARFNKSVSGPIVSESNNQCSDSFDCASGYFCDNHICKNTKMEKNNYQNKKK